MTVFYLALAGALGALVRWGISRLAVDLWGPGFPLGTLIVNLSGCFFLGLIMELGEQGSWISPELRMVIGVGFIGALTTFSTFAFETLRLSRRGGWLLAGANMTLNLVLGLALVWLGARLGSAALALRKG